MTKKMKTKKAGKERAEIKIVDYTEEGPPQDDDDDDDTDHERLLKAFRGTITDEIAPDLMDMACEWINHFLQESKKTKKNMGYWWHQQDEYTLRWIGGKDEEQVRAFYENAKSLLFCLWLIADRGYQPILWLLREGLRKGNPRRSAAVLESRHPERPWRERAARREKERKAKGRGAA